MIRIGNAGISDDSAPPPQTMIENGNAICHSTTQYEGDYKKDFYAARLSMFKLRSRHLVNLCFLSGAKEVP